MVHSSNANDGGGENNNAERDEAAEQRLQDWLCRKHWRAKEAFYLLNGLSPDESYIEQEGHKQRYHFTYFPPELCPWRGGDESCDINYHHRTQVEEYLKLTKRFMDADGEPCVRPPRDWLKLAAENEHWVPWQEFASSRPALRKYLPEADKDWKDLECKIAALEDENKKLRAELEKARPLGVKERTSALKIIVGMAAGGYKWDVRTWRPDIFKRICGDLARSEVPLADNTVRKYFEEARDVIVGSTDGKPSV